MKERVIAAFKQQFGMEPTVVTRAPGRLEIIGNHTDYNGGTVLSVAVDRAMTIAVAPAVNTQTCVLFDDIVNSTRSFDITAIGPARKGDWANYIKGIVLEFNRRGIQVPAFNAVLAGNVPLSAGMSSSAALEMAMTLALENLCDVNLGWLEEAKIGQGAENNYVGAHTGLLDQVSSLCGKDGQLVRSDFRAMTAENVPMPAGTAFVIVNCMVKHNLTNEYNERREACESVARQLNVPQLRDLTMEQLKASESKLDAVQYRRALHVVGEIERVAKGSEALQNNDVRTFGQLMYESQESSEKNFENSIPEIDLLVKLGKGLPGALGARLSGGGFGGITVHLVEADKAEAYMKTVVDEYKKQTGITAQAMICKAADGARVI